MPAGQMLTHEELKIRITIRVPSIRAYHETEHGRAIIEKMGEQSEKYLEAPYTILPHFISLVRYYTLADESSKVYECEKQPTERFFMKLNF